MRHSAGRGVRSGERSGEFRAFQPWPVLTPRVFAPRPSGAHLACTPFRKVPFRDAFRPCPRPFRPP